MTIDVKTLHKESPMKKILIVLSIMLLAPFTATVLADKVIKSVPKVQNAKKSLESRVKATQEREARKLKREKERKLEQQRYEKEKAERKRKIDAERKAAKKRKTVEKAAAKKQ